MYSTLKEYSRNTVLPVRHAMKDGGYIVEHYCPITTKGLGMDCIFPTAREYDILAMDAQRKNIYCNIYNPDFPYMFEFTPLAAMYPYDHDYKWVDTEDDPNVNYLDVFPSYDSLDDPTRVFFQEHVVKKMNTRRPKKRASSVKRS